jgi:hypothetical protein
MRSAYWLLSDDRLDLCRVRANLGLFKAHFKHSVLFNPQLAVPDSYIVNNYNFRSALRHDDTIRGLVQDQVLRVLTRAPDQGARKTLVEIRNEMPKEKVPREFSQEEYHSNEDLGFVDTVAARDVYQLSDVSRRYAVKTIEVLRSKKAGRALGADVAAAVAKHAQEAAGLDAELQVQDSDRVEKFGRAYFYYELPQIFKAATGREWQDYEARIQDFANAPYLTALPAALDLEPIYAPQHEGAFKLIRGESVANQLEQHEFRFSTSLGLHSFVKGMELLTRDDVLALLDSDEAERFQRAIGDRGPNGLDLRELRVALQQYQERIEDHIVRAFHGLTAESSDGREKQFRITFDDVFDSASDSVTYLSVGLASMIAPPAALGLVFVRPAKNLVRKVTGAAKRERETQVSQELAEATRREQRDDVLSQFMKDNGERIDALGYWGDSGKEVLYEHLK